MGKGFRYLANATEYRNCAAVTCKSGVFAMGPKPPIPAAVRGDLSRSHLENLLDHRHELYRLAGLIDWEQFDREFGRFYRARRSAGRRSCPG
jgi:hypothetical protein